MDSRTFLAPGDRVGRYEVLAEIARGGMAIVYAVRLTARHGFDKKLALKALLPHLLDDEEMVRMFIDEARVVAQIQHPHVVQVFDFGMHEGLPFLVMEYLHGQSLAALLNRGSLEEGATLHVLGKAAEGLHAAHETRGGDGGSLAVVHRDVSPQNLHVGYDGQVKVVDFGIAASKGQLHETRTDQIKGKLAYLAPEQLDRRADVTRRADVWALGVVAWQALRGEPLFRGDGDADTMWNVLNREVPRLDGYATEEVVDLIERCLQRDPRERPADCDQVGRVFVEAAAHLGWSRAGQLAEVMSERFAAEQAEEHARLERVEEVARELTATRSAPRRTAWAMGIIAAALAVAGALGFVWVRAERSTPGADTTSAHTASERPTVSPSSTRVVPTATGPLVEPEHADAGTPRVSAPQPEPAARRRRGRRRRRAVEPREPGSGGDILRTDDVFSNP